MKKRLALLVSMIATAILLPISVFAYGPDRATFTYEHPADYVTFNSITDNPNVGDERNFVRIKEDNTTSTYTDNVNIQAGKEYQVMVYYHNNAASDLNASGAGIAKDVMLRMQMASSVNSNSSTSVTGFISASNANPGTVWDSATITNTTSNAIDLSFVAGSAKVTSNGAVNGATLPDAVFSNGTKLGYNTLDGTLPGCNQYAGYVVFDIKATQPNFTLQKQVSVDNGKTWTDKANAQPGQTVLYRLVYTNTGTEQQNGVTISDKLPAGESYVSNSTMIANSVTGGKYQATSEGLTTTGLNIGSYAPNGNAYLKYSAKIADAKDLQCGVNALTNTATVYTDNGSKTTTAEVDVNNNTCELPHTGPSETMLGILGIGAVVASLGYYLSSRKALGTNLK